MKTHIRQHVIGIGAQKAASSWVHDLLRLHPDVAAGREKELDFFSYRHDRGHRWYRAQFPGPGLAFENSPSYLTDPRAPGRARAFDPDMRIVVTLRDPVDRAFSQHLHEIAKGHIPAMPFAQAVRDNPDYVEQGRYARHLTGWFDAFPASRILVLFAEEIGDDPVGQAEILYKFLGLPPAQVLMERRNVSDRARRPALRHALRIGGDALRRAGAEPMLLRLKALPPVARFLDWNSVDLRASIPPLTLAERTALRAEFESDTQALLALLDRTALPWHPADQALQASA